jgi:hypothetical protein
VYKHKGSFTSKLKLKKIDLLKETISKRNVTNKTSLEDSVSAPEKPFEVVGAEEVVYSQYCDGGSTVGVAVTLQRRLARVGLCGKKAGGLWNSVCCQKA